MKISIYRSVRYLLPFLFLGLACSVKYVGPEPVGMNATVQKAGVSGEVKIVRDENYIPHILAGNEEDLYFGVGFAMAQDRFSQMDLLRRVATGTLSEWLGDPFSYKGINLPTMDIIMRTFRFREKAISGLENMDPESRRLLEAFSSGVNRYLEELGDKRLFEYPPGLKPEKWKPEDSLAIEEFFGMLNTFDSIFEEYYYDRITSVVGPGPAMDFVQEYPKDAPVITEKRDAAGGSPKIETLNSIREFFRELIPSQVGSNNWAVGGAGTATGKALLANDPHVPVFYMPTYWYHCHLKGGGVDVAGMMFPGFPAFGTGTNGKIAWGITSIMVDYLDLYRERVNPDDPNLYLYQNRWEPFETVRGAVKVRGKKEPIHYSYRMTRHGPVLETGLVGKYRIRNWVPGEVIAFKMVDMDLGNLMNGYFNLTRAKDWNEFRAACRLIGFGPYNHIYADENGNIGYQMTATVPIRADNHGIFMHRGWTGEEEWLGLVPFDQLPHVYNPARGYLFSANNKVEPEDYPYYISSTYLPYRATRINEFLASHPKTTVKDIMALQADVVDVRARNLVPYIIKDLEVVPGEKYGDVIEALKKYRENNYESRVDLSGPTVFYLFMKFLPEFIISDELGKDLGKTIANASIPLANNLVDKIFPDPDNPWFDNVKTPKRETRADITHKVMDKVVGWMRHKLGSDPNKWAWGNAHKLTMAQPYAAYIWKRINRKNLIRGPYPYPGYSETVSAGGSAFFPWVGFRVTVGSSSRFIMDFSQPDQFYYAASTGMSSNPDDPHYDNLTQKWLKHEYLRMKLDEKGFIEGNKGTLVLKQ